MQAIQLAFPQIVHTSWTTNYFVPARNTRFTGLTSLSLMMQPNGDLFASGLRTNTSLSSAIASGTQPVKLRIRADGLVMFNDEFGPYDPTCPLPTASPVRNPNDVFAIVESGDSVEAFNFSPAGLPAARWLAHLPVDGMTLAGNGVFFTSREPAGPRIYGIAQDAVNGQQVTLYGETGTARFGDIVTATVGGNLFGYFWTQDGGGARLKRVHLADPNQPVTVLAGPVNNLNVAASRRNLATDGDALYWQEDRRVRKLFLSGGAPVNLAQTSAAPRAGVHLRGATLFFGDGNAVKSVSVMGGAVTSEVTGTSTVLSILPLPNSFIYSDASGAIAGPSAALRPAGSLNATALAHNGTRLAATQCTSANVCSLWVQNFPLSGTDLPLAAGPSAHFLMLGGAGPDKLFWGDETGLRRFQ